MVPLRRLAVVAGVTSIPVIAIMDVVTVVPAAVSTVAASLINRFRHDINRRCVVINRSRLNVDRLWLHIKRPRLNVHRLWLHIHRARLHINRLRLHIHRSLMLIDRVSIANAKLYSRHTHTE